MTAAKPGIVYLVGAGPGDPELLTLKAVDLLATADVVLHDDLVSPEILDRVTPHAIVRSVGKRCGAAHITQDQINALMVEHARMGRTVVRLKSGDPLVFGRAGEELDALNAADIPCEVVPGVTAMFAAAAAMRKPLTDRRAASKIILTTAHHAREKIDNGTPAFWQGSLPHDATLGIYMPGRDLTTLAWDMLAAGLPSELPCIVISQISLPEQRSRSTTLKHLAAMEADNKMGDAPVLVLAGRTLGESEYAHARTLGVRQNGMLSSIISVDS